jgi:predicted AAA+ superfamily ATPase
MEVITRKCYADIVDSWIGKGNIIAIVGSRRVGKSYVVKDFIQRHKDDKDANIIFIDKEKKIFKDIKTKDDLDNWIEERFQAGKHNYILIDEAQEIAHFEESVCNWYSEEDTDVIITGSNSKMLSSDILTQFRDRGDEIRVNPLSFAEVYEHYEGDKRGAWRDYYTYGGMPLVWAMESHEEKSRYLRDLFNRTYIKDVLERHQVNNDAEVLEILLNVLASGIGSLTNPSRLSNTFASERQIRIAPDTIDTYIGYFMEAFLIQKAERYDVKGQKYIKTPVKYYYSDPGLRNARLGFRQLEETHLMENVLYNDLIRRGFDVDVGVVEQNVRDESGKNVRKQLEVDFVVNRGDERYYIQSALSIDDPEKKEQEIASLIRIPDSFRKIVVVKDYMKPWRDENGIQYVGIEDFLLDESLLTR